ncbi:LLM class flavin-dependent oxidoreductase [Streptomyces sp. NPDC001351]|uniref:LLM class flavin-dependent oxidoreductase n=1 Tax=Streptomyces sp. NPDC001351 TaxID=3364564 RepID=UPI0036C95B30
MAVEFIGLATASYRYDGDREAAKPVDTAYLKRFCEFYEKSEYDWSLIPYGSARPDSDHIANYIATHTERLKVMVAHRPGVTFPTHTVRTFATLDQLSGGRVGVHVISGAQDTETRREGDYSTKAERYARAKEYIEILRRGWSDTSPHDHRGEHFRFEGFSAGSTPVRGTIPVSVGGASADARKLSGEAGDISSVWGASLAETARHISDVSSHAEAAGRPRPRFWVSFRVIMADTDAAAWARARQIMEDVRSNFGPPASTVSEEVVDRALWTALASAAGSRSASLVGSPDTIVAALLDYVDLGCELFSLRGYDPVVDATALDHHVLPALRQEARRRKPAP